MDEDLNVKIESMVTNLYRAFGTDTGILFGIPAECRPAVKAIVKIVMSEAKP